jgi:MarR family transcriptional regulator, transcriptional regulator for hemolysin
MMLHVRKTGEDRSMSDSLDRDPLVLLHDVARTMRTRFDQRARRLERQPGLSQNELAAICEVEPITVARLVDRLEKSGVVERRPDPGDRRIWRLHNLASAQPILDEINQYRQQLLQDLDLYIGRQSREALVEALLGIKDMMQRMDGNALPLAAPE